VATFLRLAKELWQALAHSCLADKACKGVTVWVIATLIGALAKRMVMHATHGATRRIQSARTVPGLIAGKTKT
jgi:hypothetical protein